MARLCRCGITAVVQSRRRDGPRAQPCQQGAKRAHASTGDEDGSAKCGEECGEENDTICPDVEQGLEQASMQSIPTMQEVGGVRGRYLPQALLRPQEHAIALTIGLIIIWCTVSATP